MFFNIKLNQKAEYRCLEALWPKPCCDVQITCAEMKEYASMVLDTGIDSIEIYATIDPQREIVTDFQVLGARSGRVIDEFSIVVSNPANSVQFFRDLSRQGGEKFDDFIKDSCSRINSEKLELQGIYVDVVDDFLEERDVRVPTSDKELKEAGEWREKDNAVRIYGSDYDQLSKEFADIAGISDEKVVIDRLNLMLSWSRKYADEKTFYTEIKKFAYPEAIKRAWGKSEMEKAKQFWKELGI